MIRTLLGLIILSQLLTSCFSQTNTDVPLQTALDNLTTTPFPRITVTEAELQRLRNALRGNDEETKLVVLTIIRDADQALETPVTFPPRGGQHNQWYQCQDCQLALQQQKSDGHQCPKCKRIYHGEPYDDVLFSQKHRSNLKSALATAWAHTITGEKKYGKLTAEILTGYAKRYRSYPYHTNRREDNPMRNKSGGHLFEQTLTEASAFATYIAPAYDLIRASDLLSNEEDQAIRKGLLRPMVENIDKHRVTKSNWQTWHNAALISGGAVLGDRALVKRAIADPKHGFLRQMEISVTEDGMWYENSWAYHFYTLRAMIQIAEYARRMEIDLWSHPRLQSMFSIGPEYAMPGGSLPRFGDDVNSRIRSVSDSLEFAYHAQSDPSLRPFLNDRTTWDSVMLGRKVSVLKPMWERESKLFPAAGHAILHSDGTAGLASAMTFGPYGGFHGHLDKLSFVFFGFDQELGVDPGRARSQAYRLPIHRNWYKATLSHNTVVVDKQSQTPTEGKLLLFEPHDRYSATVARCDDAYPGVSHTRLLLQTNNYLLIFDSLEANTNRRFDWFYHNRGESVRCDIAKNPLKEMEADYQGMEYVKDVRTGKTDNVLQATFEMQDIQTCLTLDASHNTEVLIGNGVGSSVMNRVPLIRLTRQGTSAHFAAVLEPVQREMLAQIDSVSWQKQPSGSILIKVNGPKIAHQIELALDGKTVRFVE